MSSLFADRLIVKAEEEIHHYSDRFSSGTSRKKTDRYQTYSQPTEHASDIRLEIWPTSMETTKVAWAGQERLRKGLQLFTATGQGSEFL